MQTPIISRVHYFCFFLLFTPLLISGCGSKGETTTGWSAGGWTPAPPVSVSLKREEKGLWKVSGAVNVGAIAAAVGVPLDNLGVFSIDHEFDYREDCTYIIIKNDINGTEQVFKLGVNKGKVKLHVTGDHDLTLEPEEDGKIVIDDDAHFGNMTLLVYPEGQQLATVSIDNGPSFVFLTDHRLHIKYQSIGNAIQTEQLKLDWSTLLKQDDTLPTTAVQTVIYRRSFQQSSLGIYFKPGVQEQPILVNLPRDDANIDSEIDSLQSAMKRLNDRLVIQKEYSTDSVMAPVELAIFFGVVSLVAGIMTIIGLFSGSEATGTCLSIAVLFLLPLICTLLYLNTDVDVAGTALAAIEATLSHHLGIIITSSIIIISLLAKAIKPRKYV